MINVVSCIDGSPGATAVCDAGAWASQRMNAPLQLLHVLDKPEAPAQSDLSGRLGVDSREHLLDELVELDARRNKLAQEHGKLMLEGKMDEAMDIYWRLTPARNIFEQEHMKVVMIGTYPWSLYKYYQWLVGGNGRLTRQPSLKNHQHQMDMARMALQMIGLSPREMMKSFMWGASIMRR